MNYIRARTLKYELKPPVVELSTFLDGEESCWIEFDLEQLNNLILELQKRKRELTKLRI